MYEVGSNYIDAEPLKSRAENKLVKAYDILYERLTKNGKVKPKLHILDNEAPTVLKKVIKQRCKMQLAPPDTHRRNLAERAIQTFKAHFISVLSGVDKDFPMHIWDRLIPQTVLTLNLLRQSKIDPTISAYEYINGKFDYNAMPLGPMGCAVQFHDSVERRQSWAQRALNGWYIRTSDEHYRCHCVYSKQTKAERISDTVIFKHEYITQPKITPHDVLIKAVTELTKTMGGETNIKDIDQFEAVKQLEDLVNRSPREKLSNLHQTLPSKHTRNQKTQSTTKPPKEGTKPILQACPNKIIPRTIQDQKQ